MIGVAASLATMSCSSSTFTPSADTAARTTATNTGQQVPTSTTVVNGRTVSDPEFLMETYSNSLLQVALARTALVKATHPEVRKYAQTMLDHHSKALMEFNAIAADLNVSLGLTMLPMHQAAVDKLAAQSAKDIDEEYMEEMEARHEQEVALYTAASNGAQTVKIKAYTIRTLPVLRVHLREADRIENLVD